MNTTAKPWNAKNIDTLFELTQNTEGRIETVYSEQAKNRTVYGGQVLAQALAAAQSFENERAPLSMHARFIKPVRGNETVSFEIEVLHVGRSYTVRQVRAYQNGHQVLYADCAFAISRPDGLIHILPMADNIPAPETLQTLHEFASTRSGNAVKTASQRIATFTGFELKPCDPLGMIEKRQHPKRQYWAKISSAQAGYLAKNQPILTTYLSDYWMAGAGMMAVHHHDMPDIYPAAISLDHTIWFYSDAPLDDWVFFEVDSPFAKGGFGVCRALLYHRDGRPLASVTQNVLMRI